MEQYIDAIIDNKYPVSSNFNIEGIDYCDKHWNITKSKKHSFIVHSYTPDYIIKTPIGIPRELYCSVNYSLPFILCRIKAIYKSENLSIPAEFLDITIPGKSKYLEEFFVYKKYLITPIKLTI